MGAMTRVAALLLVGVAPLSGQTALERTPNVEGVWGSAPGTIHFHFLHRFDVSEAPLRKVINSPTFLLAAGLPGDVLAGGRYASNSLLVARHPNEWEVFARWAALSAESAPVELAVQAGWNGTAESVDGEVVAGRSVGPVKVTVGGRAFSALRGEEGRAALLAGGRLRIHRWVALAADAAQVLGTDAPDMAWSAGLQLEIPYTPHSLSLHASNARTTTLQGSTIGLEDPWWGFEFTVPMTLSRWFGSGGAEPATAVAVGRGGEEDAGGADPDAVVEMDNRLRFLPDTVRVKVGGTVAWRNTSDIVHTVTADPERAARDESVRLPAGAQPFDSGDMVPGSEFRHRFTVAGSYTYFCAPHELAGMVGVVIVEP